MTQTQPISQVDDADALALALANRLGHVILWVLMLSPLLLSLNLLLLAAHVRIALGHWPTPMVESYSSAAFRWHAQGVLCFGIFAAYGALPLWILALCFKRLRRRPGVHLAQLACFLMGWIGFAAFWQWDPHDFVRWWLD